MSDVPADRGYDDGRLEAMRRKVFAVFRQFGMVRKQPSPLKVVDATEMAAHSGKPWLPSVRHDARPMGAYGASRDGEVLLVESGQPPALLVWTLAHESAHDWHAEHNPAFPRAGRGASGGLCPMGTEPDKLDALLRFKRLILHRPFHCRQYSFC